MVEAFKAVALDLCKILAKSRELEKQEKQPITQEFTYAGWEASLKQQQWSGEAHSTFVKKFFEAHRPLRAAVAKEWEKAVEEGISGGLVRGWRRSTEDGKYRPIKFKNIVRDTVGRLLFTTSEPRSLTTVMYCYERDLHVPGSWAFVPWMDGQTLEVQQAIIRGMTHPESINGVEFG
jgi:hypothetical protein